jgi:hypothetical protein
MPLQSHTLSGPTAALFLSRRRGAVKALLMFTRRGAQIEMLIISSAFLNLIAIAIADDV